MRIFTFALAALVMTCLLASVAMGKGSFGSPRSFAGGYNRIGKAGYYSQGYRYRTTGMYWRYGSRYYGYNRYRPNNYDGPDTRLGTGVYNDDQAKDVLCKRNITFDPTTLATANIKYNTTQYCFKQLYTAPGDPGNIELEDLMLDRYSWDVSVDKYPTFDLIVYPDKDITQADMNMTLRLRRLSFLNTMNSFDSATITEDIDLSTLSWSPCTLESCSNVQSNNFGRPSSRFVDNNRVITNAVTAVYNSAVRITIRVWLSDDFNEDPFFEHVFLHPAQMKIDVSIEAIATGATMDAKYVGLEAVIAHTATDMGSTVSPIEVDSAISPVIYDPAAMNRVQFGTFNDIAERKAGHMSWFTSTNKNKLCYDVNVDGSACVRFLDWGGLPTLCTAGSTTDPSVCDGLLRNGQIGHGLRFIMQTPYSSTYSARFQSHFGFINPNAVFVPNSAPMGVASMGVAALVLCLVSFLTLA